MVSATNDTQLAPRVDDGAELALPTPDDVLSALSSFRSSVPGPVLCRRISGDVQLGDTLLLLVSELQAADDVAWHNMGSEPAVPVDIQLLLPAIGPSVAEPMPETMETQPLRTQPTLPPGSCGASTPDVIDLEAELIELSRASGWVNRNSTQELLAGAVWADGLAQDSKPPTPLNQVVAARRIQAAARGRRSRTLAVREATSEAEQLRQQKREVTAHYEKRVLPQLVVEGAFRRAALRCELVDAKSERDALKASLVEKERQAQEARAEAELAKVDQKAWMSRAVHAEAEARTLRTQLTASQRACRSWSGGYNSRKGGS